MDEKLKGLLEEYVATANSGNYKSLDEVNAKFPELKDYDKDVLEDYVATVNSGKYKSLDEVNEKFPEFMAPPKKPSEVSLQGSENTSEISTEPASTFQELDDNGLPIETVFNLGMQPVMDVEGNPVQMSPEESILTTPKETTFEETVNGQPVTNTAVQPYEEWVKKLTPWAVASGYYDLPKL